MSQSSNPDGNAAKRRAEFVAEDSEDLSRSKTLRRDNAGVSANSSIVPQGSVPLDNSWILYPTVSSGINASALGSFPSTRIPTAPMAPMRSSQVLLPPPQDYVS